MDRRLQPRPGDPRGRAGQECRHVGLAGRRDRQAPPRPRPLRRPGRAPAAARGDAAARPEGAAALDGRRARDARRRAHPLGDDGSRGGGRGGSGGRGRRGAVGAGAGRRSEAAADRPRRACSARRSCSARLVSRPAAISASATGGPKPIGQPMPGATRRRRTAPRPRLRERRSTRRCPRSPAPGSTSAPSARAGRSPSRCAASPAISARPGPSSAARLPPPGWPTPGSNSPTSRRSLRAAASALDIFRQFRAGEAPRLASHQAPLRDGLHRPAATMPGASRRQCGRRSRSPTIPARTSLCSESSRRARSPWCSPAARDFEQLLARSQDGRPISDEGNGRYRLHIDIDHDGWSGLLLIGGRGPFPGPSSRPSSERAARTGASASPRRPEISAGAPRWSGSRSVNETPDAVPAAAEGDKP